MGDKENETHAGDGTGPTLGDLTRSGSDKAIYEGVRLETDPDKIRQIAAADYAHLPTMRDQRDGWDKLDVLGSDIKAFLADRIAARLDGLAAMSVYSVTEQAAKTRDTADLFSLAAGCNRAGFDGIITEVERFHTRVKEIEGELSAVDGDLSGIDPNLSEEDKLAQRKGLNQVKDGLADELRTELAAANTAYQAAHELGGYSPPRYDGAPEWTGPDPRTPPGWGGHDPGAGARPVAPVRPSPGHGDVIVDDGPGFGDDPDVIVDDGPELQTPAPAPAPSPAPVTPGPTPPPGSGIPSVPPGPPPGNGIIRPTPPPGPRPVVGPPGARPTPGLGTPPSRSLPGRAGGPGGGIPSRITSGRSTPAGTKASRALLPNQRTATAAGTNPTRVAGTRAGADPSRPGPRSTVTTPFGGRARTTVPPVIGSRAAGTPTATPPTRTAGKVFGERANKGRTAKKPLPKKLGGILQQKGFNQKLAPQRSWSNAPGNRRTDDSFQGKVIGGRTEPVDALAAAAEAALLRHEAGANREALAKWRANRRPLPDRELTDGLNPTVVPDVIETNHREDRVRREDIGPVFGRTGWENRTGPRQLEGMPEGRGEERRCPSGRS